MLLRNRAPSIESPPVTSAKGYEHLAESSIAVLRWLCANRVDFVLVGPVARAIRGERSPAGPVAIVPAPYGRNLDRLARALWSAHARLRVQTAATNPTHPGDTLPIKLTAEKLVGAQRWALRCGSYEIDVEGRPAGVPRFQELLYEASKLEIAPEVAIEVASPEDIEHYDHIRRTGRAPEITITRAVRDPELP
jgi:hypothetical protein